MRGPRTWLAIAVIGACPMARATPAQGPSRPRPAPTPSNPQLEEPPLPTLTPTPPFVPADHQVRPASDRVPGRVEQLESLRLDPGREAAQVAARVGDTIITLRELKRAIRDRLGAQAKWSDLSREDKDAVGRGVLESLVDRAIILQSARKRFDKPKQWETFREFFEASWKDHELPNLMRRYKCENEVALRLALEKLNDSLDERREIYLQEQMARAYTSEMIRHKVANPGPRDLYGYYRNNLARFDRPAEITWREIRISSEKFPDSATRLARAEEARARLARGEDFATVARALSDSPRAAQGGLWSTTPGGFASAPVNAALDRLRVGEISPLIDDSKAFYIVQIERRRPPGPAPFEDVQGQISEALLGQAYEKALEIYIRDLRATIPVSYPIFESTSTGGPG